MRTFLILVALLFTSICSADIHSLRDEEPRWQPIIAYKIAGGAKAYINKNNLKVATSRGGVLLTSGEILVSFPGNHFMNIRGTKVNIKSISRFYLISCETGIASSIADFYYTVLLPKNSDEPAKSVMHPDPKNNMTNINKGTPVYSALCPIYV